MLKPSLYAALWGTACALPAPQDIDVAFVAEQPDPSYTIDAITAASQVISYDPSSILAEVTQAVSSVSIPITAVADPSATAVSDAASSLQLVRRSASACGPLAPGATGAPTVVTDTPSAFAANTAFASAASNAATPAGYSNTFTNLNASALSYGFLGFSSLNTYDTIACSQACDSKQGCMAFNIYFERDPSVMPATGCDNPTSVTSIVCALWGGPLSLGTAQNFGTKLANFQSVIAGSNGYVNQTVATPSGYATPVSLGSSALNAPYDKQGYNTYMGFKLFTQGVFNISLCAAYCDAQTVYNLAHPPTDGSPAQKCRAFNTYIIYKNNAANVQGQYCVLYSESWDQSYATNTGSWYKTDHYMIESSYSSYNKTDQGPSPAVGDQLGAIYQAAKDISWSSLQPYCSGLLVSPAAPSTMPAGLAKYPASVVTAACSLRVTLSKGALTSSTSGTASSLPTGTGAMSSSALPSSTSTSSTASSRASSSAVTASSTGSSTSTGSSSSAQITSSSSHPMSGAGLGFKVTRPTSLDSLALSYYTQITSGLTYNKQGTIQGTLKQATATTTMSAVTADPSDLSAQASLQAQLQKAGLPSSNATVSDVLTAMDNALMGNGTSNSTGDFEDWISSDDSSSNQTLSSRSVHLSKRYSFGDFLDDVDTYVCNDLVTGLCEYIEDACDLKDGAEAIYCLASGCLDQALNPPPPPPVQYSFDQTYNMQLPSFKGDGHVYKDASSTLLCSDCGMSISNFRLQGTIVVDLQSASIVSSTMTLSQDVVQRFNMNVVTNSAASGSWSYIMSTQSLQSITATGVFTISPQLLYAIGASWSTNAAAGFSFGATSSLNGASVQFDPVQGKYPDGSNWQPALAITQPQLIGASATLIPWMKSSVQISLQILGNSMPNAITLNQQISLGFTNSYVTMAKLGHTKCGGGQMQSTSYQNLYNSLVLASGEYSLYLHTESSAPTCQDASIMPPSAAQFAGLASAPGAGPFCTSFIGYQPSTTNVTVIQTSAQASSTVTVIGTGTTTITPSPTTTTVTVSSSVSSIALQMKRSNIYEAISPTITASAEKVRRNLEARRVIRTPIIVSTWLPQQVSAVCSSIATGVARVNVTSTQTITSGVTTATIQGTVTAATPTSTATSVIYVPAVAPYNQVKNPGIAYVPGNPSPWNFNGATNNYYYHIDAPRPIGSITRNNAQVLGTGSFTQSLSGLEPGFTYALSLTAGFASTTDSCTVIYSLDGVPFESYSPSNTATYQFPLDWSTHAKQKRDGTYYVVATSTTQTLSIGMSCTAPGGFAEFGAVNFWGPLIDSP